MQGRERLHPFYASGQKEFSPLRSKTLLFSEKPPSNVSSCSAMTCDQTFDLPRNFSDGTTEVDLGRSVQLKTVEVRLKQMILSLNVSLNITLTPLGEFELHSSVQPCYYIRQDDNFNFRFDCLGRAGRFLVLVVYVNDNKDNATTVDSGVLNKTKAQ